MPSTLKELEKVEVQYESERRASVDCVLGCVLMLVCVCVLTALKGWKSDISKVTKFEDLPSAARVRPVLDR
jgi:adenylosuccinate synthase